MQINKLHANRVVDFAAEELQKYIRLICGAQLQIVADDNAYIGQVIAIGGPERNACTRQWISEEAFDKEVPGLEGIMIRDHLVE